MAKFGPTRGEHIFRLTVSVAGLIGLAAAYAAGLLPDAAILFEALALGGGFFALSAIYSARKLVRGEHR